MIVKNKRILDWQALKEQLEQGKANQKTVVFTNGCFDIIHVGHIQYLYEAKALGDTLVVGLNADSSVSAIKPGRPIMNQNERLLTLSALEMVDYVTLFYENTPLKLIQAIQPDVLVKGADWALEDIVGRDEVKQVFRLAYIDGVSTTAIIKRIAESWQVVNHKLVYKGDEP